MKKEKDYRLICFIIICNFLRFHPLFLPSILAVYSFDAIIFLALFVYTKRLTVNRVVSSALFMLIIFALIKSVIIGIEMDVWLAIAKLYYYCFVYERLSSIAKGKYKIEDFNALLNFCLFFNVTLIIIQLFDIPLLEDVVHLLYGYRKWRTLWMPNPRVYGTFFNFNWFGLYLIFMVGYYTNHFCKNGKVVQYFVKILCVFTLLFASGSRTAMIGAIFILFINLLVNRDVFKLFALSFGSIGLLSLTFLFIDRFWEAQTTLKRFTSYFISLFSQQEIDLALIAGSRWDEWKNSWQAYSSSPMMGVLMGDIIPHNSYIATLIRFGVIGTLFIMPILYIAIKNLLVYTKDSETQLLGISLVISYAFVMISGDYFYTTQIMLILIIVLSIGNSRNYE